MSNPNPPTASYTQFQSLLGSVIPEEILMIMEAALPTGIPLTHEVLSTMVKLDPSLLVILAGAMFGEIEEFELQAQIDVKKSLHPLGLQRDSAIVNEFLEMNQRINAGRAITSAREMAGEWHTNPTTA